MTTSPNTMPTALIFPIEVLALRVGSADSVQDRQLLQPTYDFHALPDGKEVASRRRPYTAQTVSHNARTFASTAKAAAGVHLHWDLPSFLRHGTQEQQDDGKLRFPSLPNRWIVSRFATAHASTAFGKEANARTVCVNRQWLVESDRLSSQPMPQNGGLAHPSVPIRQAGKPPAAYLGWRRLIDPSKPPYRADDNVDAAWSLENLTAIGYGDPAFTTIYGNCSTVLGCHDDLSDLLVYSPSTQWTLAYHVAGWYEPRATPGEPRMDESAILTALSRQAKHAYATGCDRIVCSGAIHALEWSPSNTYLTADTSPDLSNDAHAPTTFSIGQTEEEAMSAALADAFDAPALERPLTAMQFGGLSGNRAIDGAVGDVADALHEAGFKPFDTGRIWTLKLRDTREEDKSATNEPDATISPESLALLDVLNDYQRAFDDSARRLSSMRDQLFADWQKWMTLRYAPSDAPPAFSTMQSAIADLILAQVSAITALGADHAAARKHCDAARRDLEARITDQAESRFVGLVDIAAPRAWQPQEPVLMITGEAAKVLPPPLFDTSAPPLPRREKDIASRIALPDGTTIDAVKLFDRLQVAAVPLGGLLDQLAREIPLTSPAFQEHIAEASHVSALADALRRSATRFNEKPASPDNGVGHFYGTARPGHPLSSMQRNDVMWRASMFRYETHFRSSWEETDDDMARDLSNRFDRTPQGDWTPKQGLNNVTDQASSATVDVSSKSIEHSGVALLSRHGHLPLLQAIGQLRERLAQSDGTLPEAWQGLEQWVQHRMPHTAQSLTGRNAALLMGTQTLQMHIDDPYADPELRRFVDLVRGALQGHAALSALNKGAFMPLDGGAMTLKKVQVLDRFGQIKTYTDFTNTLNVADRAKKPDAPGDVVLPARIVPPARLSFRWLPVTPSRPDPVVAWVLVSPIDNALSFYTAAGTAICTLALNDHGAAFPEISERRPVSNATAIDPASDAARLIESLRQEKRGALRTFLDTVNAALAYTRPAGGQHGGIAGLTGRPLAIVRAGLSLDLPFGAPIDPSWEALQQRLGQAYSATTRALMRTRFPVYLGSRASLNDGFIGFWRHVNNRADFSTFYSPLTDGVRNASPRPDAAVPPALYLRPDSDHLEVLTALIDPFGEVEARTGFLPEKSITLPSEFYAAPLKRLSIALESSPILTVSSSAADAVASASMVLPQFGRDRWSWVSPSGMTSPVSDVDDRTPRLDSDNVGISDGWLTLDPDAEPH